jgi:hypothetical protein
VKARSLVGIGLAAAAAALLVSCNPLSSPLPNNAVDVPVVQHLASSGTFTYTVDPGATPGDVYFVFTNPSVTANAAQKPSVQSASIVIDGKSLPAPSPQPLYSVNSGPRSLADRIAEFNRDPFKAIGRGGSAAPKSESPVGPGEPSFDLVGDNAPPFNDLGPGGTTISVSATCRFVSTPVTVADGTTRKLNIWVANDCWTGGTKRRLVDGTMVTALANSFLNTGAGSDIYDWVTAVVGVEWGTHGYIDLIPPNGEITILLSDIEKDNSDTGGIVGYFWAGNNFTTASVPDSNQRIMFVIDAVMYANPNLDGSGTVDGSVWAPDVFWPKIIFSTLAHEFQHMIQFYQKQILRAAATGTDTWINEMCSMIMEDLVADKLGVEGPRGIANADGSAGSSGIGEGRIPDFNLNSYYPLAVNNNYGLTDYSISYAFGSWLARNYGGTELLRRIVQCPETNSTAATNAVAADSGRQDESMARLLEKWSASVLLSDMTTAPVRYRYNTGGWTTSTAGGLSYNLGSINIFNYTPALYVFTQAGTVPGTVFNRSSNIYYQAALDLGTARSWTITVPQGILMTVVIK